MNGEGRESRDRGCVEKRILLAGIFHQTNTLVGGRTGLEDFKVRRGEEMLQADGASPTAGVLEVARERDWEAIATVQNRYNLTDRASEEVLEFCEREGLGFIPWFPLATGELAKPGGPLDEIATRHDATPSQVALAWLLRRSPVMLPIPGTSSVEHLEENAAASLELSSEEFATLTG